MSNSMTFTMQPIDKLVAELDEDTRLAIIREFDEFESTGKTGDTMLRRYAEDFMEKLDVKSHMATIFMMQFGYSCHKINSIQAIAASQGLDPIQAAIDAGPGFGQS